MYLKTFKVPEFQILYNITCPFDFLGAELESRLLLSANLNLPLAVFLMSSIEKDSSPSLESPSENNAPLRLDF